MRAVLNCSGAEDCPATFHYHGCYRDFGACDSALEHDSEDLIVELRDRLDDELSLAAAARIEALQDRLSELEENPPSAFTDALDLIARTLDGFETREIDYWRRRYEAAKASHDAQLRNTMAFKRECDALRGQLDGGQPTDYWLERKLVDEGYEITKLLALSCPENLQQTVNAFLDAVREARKVRADG